MIKLFKKVEAKIQIAIIICCLTITTIQSYLLYINVNTSLTNDMHDLVSSTTEGSKNLIEQRLVKVMDITNDISSIVESIVDPNLLSTKAQEYENTIDPIIKKIVGDNIDYVMGAYLLLDPERTDKVYGSYYEDVEVNGNLKKMEKYDKSRFDKANNKPSWYYECVPLKEGKWFEPYVSSAGIEMTSFTRPIYRDNTFVGMLSIDINFKLFKEYVNSINLDNSGYVFILNENLDFIMHRNYTYEDNLATLNESAYKDIAEKIKSDRKDIFKINLDGEDKFLTYSKLSNGWIVCAAIGEDALIKNKNHFIKLVLYIAVLGIIVSFIIAKIVGKRISSVITYVTNSLNTLSNLDLTISPKGEAYERKHLRKDQLGIMISSTMNLRKHLRNIIPQIQDNSKITLEYSNNLDNSIEQSSSSMSNISEIMNQLASGSQEQTKNAQDGVSKLSVLADMIEFSIASASNVKSHLDKTQNANKINMEQMQNLSDKFEINKNSSKQVSESVAILSEKVKNIQNMVDTIEAIARKTNMLSLNAAIEAAAAGEHGKGFAVVAEEIGKLAAQTSAGTKQIQSIVNEISENMNITESSMKIGEAALSEASTAMTESYQSFGIIDKDIDSMANVANDLISTIEKVNQNKEDVILAINSILSVSEQTAASVENIIETVHQEDSNIKSLIEASKNLKNISNTLDEIVNSFKIN